VKRLSLFVNIDIVW